MTVVGNIVMFVVFYFLREAAGSKPDKVVEFLVKLLWI